VPDILAQKRVEMIGLLLAAALQAGAVSASTMPGGAIVDCAQRDDLELDGCIGYILGVADTLQLDGKTCHAASDLWTRQTVAVVRKYVSDHPERWSKGAPFLVREGLIQAFPCPKR
jgi:hypothetical protein